MSGWGWGTAGAVAFYLALPSLPLDPTFRYRYFESHWIEYATMWLFCVGICTVGFKALAIPSDRSALSEDLLDGIEQAPGASAIDMVSKIEAQLRLTAKRHARSQVVRRILDLCNYVRARRSASGVESQLSYMADVASGRLHSDYALVRTITWAIPILGFLGTVIGITMAIANVTPEQLESSLNEVTAGLAVAFDTTALSLALSMILVFLTFVVERAQGEVLDRVEDYGVKRLVACFAENEEIRHPWLEAEQQAADQLLSKSEGLISWQTQLWQSSLEELRARWTESMSSQQQALSAALQLGISQSLLNHSEQLAELRTEFTTTYQRVSADLVEQLAESQWALKEQQQKQAEQLQQAQAQQNERLQALVTAISESTVHWQSQLAETTSAVSQQATQLREHTTQLLRLAEQGDTLVSMEGRLAGSLEAARAAESLEQTLLGLNAAVHVLTSRTMSRAA